jgi:hypothetical protein
MNPFVEAVVEAAVAVMEAAVTEVVVTEVAMEDTVTVVADTVADIGAEVMVEDMEAVGVIGAAGGPSMAGLIAEASPVLIIFSKSLNDHPFSQ